MDVASEAKPEVDPQIADAVVELKVEDVKVIKPESDEYAYLERPEFSSEKYKIEIRGLPKYYGMNEFKKLLNAKLQLDSCKLKSPRPGSPWAYACFRNDEDRDSAIVKINGFVWKGKTLTASIAKPAPDPLVKRRNETTTGEESANPKKRRTLAESTTPLAHISYEDQLKQKQGDIERILKEYGNQLWKCDYSLREQIDKNRLELNGMPFELREIKASPLITGYRNKCEFSIGKDASGDAVVGFRMGSYVDGLTEVGPIADLVHIPELMKRAVASFQKFVRTSTLQVFNPEEQTGHFRQLMARISNATSELMLVVGIHPQTLTAAELTTFKDELREFFEAGDGKEVQLTSLYYQEIKKRASGEKATPVEHLYGSTHINDEIHNLKFRISPEAFFQVNTPGAEVLYQCAIDLGAPTAETTVLDICCGTGTIGLCFAKHCKNVYGVEIIAEAVKDAEFNSKTNSIENCEFFTGDANDVISSMMRRVTDNSDCLAIVDPPRAGLHVRSVAQLRNAEKLKRVIYISCSPQSAMKNWLDLTRPSSKTLRGDPFIPKIALPVDMFPQTPHTELIVLFERKNVVVEDSVASECP